MSAATAQGQLGTGATVSWANAEGGIVFNLNDTISGTTPIAIPTATGENYSWIKNLVIAVTVAGTTTFSNRTVKMSTTATTGLYLYWKAVAVASYAQAASGNRPASSGSNNSTPAGYTLMTTTATQYDGSSVSSGSTGPNGSMCVCAMGCDNLYLGGAGSAISLPSIILQYDES